MSRCLVRCVSCCPRVLPTSQGVLCRWMAGRAYTDHRGSFRVEALMKYTVDEHGRIDYLVNNGGGQFASPVADIKAKGWHAVIDTNLTGTFHCLKHVYHAWMKENGGSIVNIIVDMVKGLPGLAHTGAARAGVENLMKSMAIEWAPNKIRINSIAPGFIFSKTAVANYVDPDMFNRGLHTVPARRLGYPEEVSSAVCFLLSPGAAYITGCTVPVDGRQSIYRSPWVIQDHEGFPVPLHSDTQLPPKGEVVEPPPSEDLYRAALEIYKSKL